jgi:hypothetical protein
MISDRRSYQHEVDRLLDAIGGRGAELQGLMELGVRGRGLADREGELAKMRRRLATLVGERMTHGSAPVASSTWCEPA